MPAVALARPSTDEYAEYYRKYVDQVPDGDILDILALQQEESLTLLRGLDDQRALTRYAPGKWSIKETIGHLADTERIFGYRTLRFARGDSTELAGFDQSIFVENGGFDARAWNDLLDEWQVVRDAGIRLFRGLDEQALLRQGTASGWKIIVRAYPWIIAGHERHHMSLIRERYLGM